MKQVTIILLALVMVLSLCACGGTTAPEPTPEPTLEATPEPTDVWGLQTTVDEFGDVTEDSETWLGADFIGDFSNTATISSELMVNVGFIYDVDFNQFVARFTMLEYSNSPVTYFESDDAVLKMKINGEVYEYPLIGLPPDGSLFLSPNEYEYGANILFDELFDGNDVRCIISIGSSQYNFTAQSGNFREK